MAERPSFRRCSDRSPPSAHIRVRRQRAEEGGASAEATAAAHEAGQRTDGKAAKQVVPMVTSGARLPSRWRRLGVAQNGSYNTLRVTGPMAMLWLLLALSLLTLAHAGDEGEAGRPHCADFMQYCAWNASTSSCKFQKSVTFGCGPRAATGSMASWSSSSSVDADAFVGDAELSPAAVLDSGCRWDIAGDLSVASSVVVEVEGDDCLLHIGSGKMVLLEVNASLRAASLSVEASFVHLEAQAEIAASYSGNYHGVQGMFTGTDVFGASYGGGGGQRLIANSTMLTEQTTRGFFDVRGRTVHLPNGKDKEKILRESSGGWHLANVWAEERSVLTSTAAASSSSTEEDDEGRSAQIARLLLGSGSRVVVIGNGTQEQVLSVDGGGRIQIMASKDVVVMKGARIQANGASAVEGVSGGSGGSVFISANALSVAGSVEARGGDAFCSDEAADRGITHCYPAGGGGRVQISFMSSQLSSNAVDTTGGSLDATMVETLLTKSKRFRLVQVTSLAGAAGTYYQVVKHSDGAHETQLLVSNGLQRLWPDGAEGTNGDPVVGGVDAGTDKVVGGAVTSLHIGNDKPGNVNALTVTDGAIVASNCLHFSTGDFKVLNGSYLVDALLVSATDSLSLARSTSASDIVSSAHPVFQMRVRDMLVSSNSRLIFPTSALQLSARSVSMDATAALRFTWSAQITTSQNLHLDANVSSALSPVQASTSSGSSPATVDYKVLELVSGGNVFIGGYVVVGALSISSEFSVTIDGQLEARNAASIKSAFNTCKQQQWTSKAKKRVYDMDKKDKSESEGDTPVPPLPSKLPMIRNYTVVLHARESIYLGQSEEVKEELKEELEQQQQNDDPLPPEPVGVVRGGAVLVCAADTIEISLGSMISSDGMGELANQGPGTGSCARSIGGGAGYGGRGADSSVVSKIGEYASGGLPYGTRSGAGMLGSGGGCVGGGNGGGVIMLGASGLVLNGGVHCNGDGGANGGGGGSGGFLGISVSQFLRGHGHISSVGGGSECAEAVVTTIVSEGKKTPPTLAIADGQTDAVAQATQAQVSKIVPRLCGGGGGGGRLQLTGCELSSFDRCTSGFDGNYTVAGGATVKLDDGTNTDQGATAPPLPTPASTAPTKSIIPAGASGSFFGFPCPPGSGGLFCRLCATGKFKSESNSAECVACSNAPSNAHYIGVGASSSSCSWACDPGYSGYYCVSPLQQLLDACGGEFGFALVLMSIVTFFILLGYACRNRKEPSYTRMYNNRATKGERQHLLSSAVANSQRSRFASLFHCFFWPRVSYPKLLERDLPEHMARLYFSGHNEPESPLKLRMTVPQSLTNVLYEWEFKKLADRINAALSWRRKPCSSWGKIVYFLVWLLCYPFASEVMLFRRHIRVNALKRIVATYNHACMKGPRARGLLNAVKLGYCADYSLVYLELLYKESSQSVCVPTTKIGKPSLPLVLLFAGCGTYFSPYFLDPNDLLVRSIPQCPELTAFIDEPWIEFVAELNELLRVVQRDEASLVESLLPVATFLEKRRAAASTSATGKLGGLRIYLGRFYVQDELDMGEEFKLGLFLTTAEETVETVSSNNNLQSMLQGTQPPSSAGRFGYGNNGGYPKDSGYGYPNGNINDVYGYGRGDALDLLDPRGSGQQGYAEALPYDMGGWGTALTSMSSGSRRSLNDGNGSGNSGPTGGKTAGSTAKNPVVSSIREEALRIRSSGSIGDGSNMGLGGLGNANIHGSTRGSGTPDDMLVFVGSNSSGKKRRDSAAHHRRAFYEGWLGPVDASLPVPGVLIMADELRERLADRTARQRVEAFLRFHLLPRNLPRSSSLNLSWMLSISLLTLLMVDLAITFAMVVNLKCVTDGEVDHNCSASIMIPVLLVPPLALVVSPIMGIVSLALSSSTFTRRFSVWNALSMISVVIAICACIAQSSRLVAPWFAGPLPLLPVIALAVKAGQAYLIERYIAFQETERRRRGWRGIMKRRLSDASIPTESP